MQYMTISEVSRVFGVSTRMLRHYEKLGMISSTRREDYAYRIYDEYAVRRVQQIVILRKFQIPLKQIMVILEGDTEAAVRVLEKHISEMDDSIGTMKTMKEALERLMTLLKQASGQDVYTRLIQDDVIMKLAGELSLPKNQLKEEKIMSSQSKEMLRKEDAVRMVYLPPYTVAACQHIGKNPEDGAGEMMNEFIRTSGLYEKKPDARLFGFNHPDPKEGDPVYGYEFWVTIPEDMEVPEPLTKKHFDGGLYAAYTINFPDFFEWQFLTEWVMKNEVYQENFAPESEHNMGGCLEEHLNWVYSIHTGETENGIRGKLDLLLPVKKREIPRDDAREQ